MCVYICIMREAVFIMESVVIESLVCVGIYRWCCRCCLGSARLCTTVT